MTMRNLVVHVGPHKTGTTAIQKALVDFSEDPEVSEWIYPDIGFTYYGHHAFAEAIVSKPSPELAAIVDQLLSAGPNVIVSSENFSRLGPDHWGRLRDLLPADIKVRLVFFLRNPLDTLFSSWQESIKHGETLLLPEYLLRHLAAPYSSPILNSTLSLESMASAFGREHISIHSYEDASLHPYGLVGYFFAEILGLSKLPETGQYENVNRSFDLVAIEVLRMLSRAKVPDAVQLMLEDPDLKRVARRIVESSPDFIDELTLDLNMLPMKVMEGRLGEWQDRFGFDPDSTELFRKRSRSYAFLDPSFWIAEPEVTEMLRVFIHSKLRIPDPHSY